MNIDQIDPSDRLPRQELPPRDLADYLTEFVELRIEDQEGRYLDLGPIPAPAGLNKAQAAVWVAEVYFPQVIQPKAKYLLDIVGEAPSPADLDAARKFMRHHSE